MKSLTVGPNEVEPTTLLRQLANVDDVLAHWPRGDEKWLDLDDVESTCGTYRCLYGDFLERKTCGLAGRYVRSAYFGEHKRTWFFGVMGERWYWIFGASFYGTLDQRHANLLAHRTVLETRIAEWVKAREVAV